MRRAILWLFLLIMCVAGASLVTGQTDERLVNPSLEEGTFGPYTTRRGGEFPIFLPGSWNFWAAPASGEFFNRAERTTIFPHPGPGPAPLDGGRALNISCGFVTCTVAIYQQVAVQANTPINASAWAQVKACNPAPDATSCGSAVESGAQTRIGIDPNGGTDPNDPDIVWSGWVQPHDQWLEMTVAATTSGTTATLYLYSTQASTAAINKTYWDKATLKGGGVAGAGPTVVVATPTPTPIPEVPFVVPQEARPDGSIIHTVGVGDTLDSIAFAYGTTRTAILELNPTIKDSRFITVGQEILVKEAEEQAPTEAPTATPAEVSEVTEVAQVSATQQAPVPVAPSGIDPAVEALFPALIAPAGAALRENSEVRGGGGPSGQRTGFQSVILVSDQTAETLVNDYTTQLAAMGWQQVSGGVGSGFGWSIWRFQDAGGTVWGATLSLTASPINVGQYTFLMQIEEGPNLG